MLILLIISTIEISLYPNKDTYLMTKDILLCWEMVNILVHFKSSFILQVYKNLEFY